MEPAGGTSIGTEVNQSPCVQGDVTINTRERYSRGLRWKLGINTMPCIQSRQGNRCVFCGFLNDRSSVSPLEVGRRFNDVFWNSKLDDIHRLELYVSGSFFDNDEVSPNSRLEIIKAVGGTGISEVVLESRPEFITEENLRPLLDHIEPERVTIAVGVETMDDKVRHKLAKGFTRRDLIESINRIAVTGMTFQAYLLLKPPVIENDGVAIQDVIRSSEQIIDITKNLNCPLILAIQPFFLAKNSPITQNAPTKNNIKPPWLYTIALTLKLLDKMRDEDGFSYMLILGNEIDNVDTVLVPSNYSDNGHICSCTDEMKQHLLEINISNGKLRKSVSSVLDSECRCKTLWQKEIDSKLNEFCIELPT